MTKTTKKGTMTQPNWQTPQTELREQIGRIFVKNDLRTDQRAISEIVKLLTSERTRLIEEVEKKVIGTLVDLSRATPEGWTEKEKLWEEARWDLQRKQLKKLQTLV